MVILDGEDSGCSWVTRGGLLRRTCINHACVEIQLKYTVRFTLMKSRYVTVYTLRNKSVVIYAFKKFYQEIKTKVKVLRSSNGGEYRDVVMDKFCEAYYIKQVFLVPLTRSRMVWRSAWFARAVEMTRYILNDSGFDESLRSNDDSDRHPERDAELGEQGLKFTRDDVQAKAASRPHACIWCPVLRACNKKGSASSWTNRAWNVFSWLRMGSQGVLTSWCEIRINGDLNELDIFRIATSRWSMVLMIKWRIRYLMVMMWRYLHQMRCCTCHQCERTIGWYKKIKKYRPRDLILPRASSTPRRDGEKR